MAAENRDVRYGGEIARVEPLGIEHVPSEERHGKTSSIFTLWFGANVELATLTTGVAAVSLFGLSFAQAAVGLIIGNILGALVLGLVSTFGPRLGVPQMVHSRSAFGFFGNFLPGAFNMIAGALWFAVNTVLGTFAFETLFHTGFLPGLIVMVVIQVVVAVYGHNMIHAIERWMAGILTLVFIGVSIFAFSHANYALPFNVHSLGQYTGVGGSVIEAVGLAFSYLLGWTVFGSDYTRYLPEDSKPFHVFRNATSSNFIAALWLELVGVALATIFPKAASNGNPMGLLTGINPHWLVSITLVAVMIGTVTANVLNIYSGSLSALVINIPLKRWMAAVLVGIVGGAVAWIGHTSYYMNFENFLFLLAYWLSPWVAVVLVDFFIIHKGRYTESVFYNPGRVIRSGLWSWAIAIVVSVPFFNQTLYQGIVATHYPHLGDLSYYVSFVVAGILYMVLGRSMVQE